ncbi:MAG: type III pantothenate kinase [Oscillospiraceae bacterium]|nr:type III pantothenate kinase [Oscillospiraceae bacterium]
MLVAIDVGNTNIVMGVYKNRERLFHFRVATSAEKSRDEYGLMFIQLLNHRGVTKADIEGVIISSVVPPVMYSLERAVKDYLGKTPIVVTNEMDLGMDILYENPKEVGADRLVNAVAVLKRYAPPAIVVDFGTATTYCAINEKGQYMGGAISPGIKISVEALFSRTAKLPRIELTPTERIIGRSTVESMQAGVLHGYAGQVDYIVGLMKHEMGCPEAKVIATGGLATMISREAKSIDVIDGMLTLDGLLEIYEMQKGKTK